MHTGSALPIPQPIGSRNAGAHLSTCVSDRPIGQSSGFVGRSPVFDWPTSISSAETHLEENLHSTAVSGCFHESTQVVGRVPFAPRGKPRFLMAIGPNLWKALNCLTSWRVSQPKSRLLYFFMAFILPDVATFYWQTDLEASLNPERDFYPEVLVQ